MKTLFLPLFSETEPSETVLLKQTPVVIHLAMLLFLTVLVPFTTFSEMFNPPTALKNLVIVTVSFLLFIVSILTRNLHTPWHSIYGVVSGFGFAATTTLALVFRDCVLSLPLLELLSLSLLFYSVIRLSARRAAVSYAIFLILLLGATTSSVATIVDA
ncbi:MAG: hypothetical protein N2234_11100, partial [Planctomycetota bacterium]|nr:hypothetical protein [Planctomycetota bacterium]